MKQNIIKTSADFWQWTKETIITIDTVKEYINKQLIEPDVITFATVFESSILSLVDKKDIPDIFYPIFIYRIYRSEGFSQKDAIVNELKTSFEILREVVKSDTDPEMDIDSQISLSSLTTILFEFLENQDSKITVFDYIRMIYAISFEYGLYHIDINRYENFVESDTEFENNPFYVVLGYFIERSFDRLKSHITFTNHLDENQNIYYKKKE
jgi:hypothetical protein